MRIGAPMSGAKLGLVWVPLALLFLSGCQSTQSTAQPLAANQNEAVKLLNKVPAELRWNEPAEDLAAQERYIKVLRLVRNDGTNGYISSGMQTGTIDSSQIVQVRKIIKSGPIQIGFDESLVMAPPHMLVASPSMVSGLLLESAEAALRAKNSAQATEDIQLAFSWMIQTNNSGAMEMTRTYDAFGIFNRIAQSPNLTEADRKKIISILPTEETLINIQKDQVKQVLEAKIYALAGLTAPRKDLVISRIGQYFGYGSGSANPKTSVVVPPHGTLDKEETLQALVEIARLTILGIEAAVDNQMGMQRQVTTDFVKWLPTTPPQLTTNTKAERDYVKKKVDVYVEEMNKGENTLGRQFLQSWQVVPMDMRPNLSQLISDFKRNLAAPNRPTVK